jgi:predicted kinase
MKKQTLTIICGAPGSGKSTLAQHLVQSGYVKNYFEADMWMMEKGEYKFDPKKLHHAHTSCQNAVRKALELGDSVIVANTNIKPSERKIYIQIAKETNSNVQLIRVDGNFGSIHNVPIDKVTEMRDNLQKYWNPQQELNQQ